MKGQAYILYRESLLARGLERLLADAGVHLSKIDLKGPSPLEVLLSAVQPGDTVLMERQDEDDRSWERVLGILRRLPAVALILVDPSSSRVQVFLHQQCPISSPEELAKVIGWWGEWGRRICDGRWE